MVNRVYPVPAISGTPTYNGRYLRQTTVAPFVAGATAARPLGARSGVRLGTSSTTVTATSTTWTVNPHAGVIDGEAANEAGPYTWSFDAVQTGAMNAAGAFARIDLISVQINDSDESDGTLTTTPSNASIVYTPGTAAAPALPTQPPRSVVIAQINVPASGGGGPSVTWVAPGLVAAGGITPATTAAFGSGTYVGQYIDDPVRGLLRWNGSAWVAPVVAVYGSGSLTGSTTETAVPGCTLSLPAGTWDIYAKCYADWSVAGAGPRYFLNLRQGTVGGTLLDTSQVYIGNVLTGSVPMEVMANGVVLSATTSILLTAYITGPSSGTTAVQQADMKAVRTA